MAGFLGGPAFCQLIHPAPTQRVQDEAADRDALFGVSVLEAVLLDAADALAEVTDAALDDQPGEIGIDILDVLPT